MNPPQVSTEARAPDPVVAILLCTSNGEKFLREQLNSIQQQLYRNWCVIASDDGSTDDTREILLNFQEKHGADKVDVRRGPRKGFVANFLSLVCDSRVHGDYFAFSDQDDIWEVDKLSRAIAWLREIPARAPALYCSRTRLIDAEGREIGFSPLLNREPSFANALVQSLAGANTMVINQATRKLLARAGATVEVASHDWWTYLIVSACGGAVKYDPYPSVRYRQHERNLVGMNANLVARIKRARMLWNGVLKGWSDRHLDALAQLRPHMTHTNRDIFDHFCRARQMALVSRLAALHRTGVHRQGKLDNVGLAVAAFFKKI